MERERVTMEELKGVFGSEALTYDQFVAKVGEQGESLKLANLAGGGYVSVDKYNAKVGELSTANSTISQLQEAVKKFNGVDVDGLRTEISNLQTKYNEDIAKERLERALEIAIMGGKARDTKAVKPFLDLSQISMDGETIKGVAEQLEQLKKDKGYLFEDIPTKTGMRHPQGGGASANDALRAAFGRG